MGIVSVDNCFHYLWGGGYVIDAAKRGYIAYTNCTSSLAEVVPFGGKSPTLGTNPHSWGLPTQDAIGFPICVDWATSTCAMGRVQQLKREGKQLPPMAAVDTDGNPTQDPSEVAALLPFGAHKGYGLSLINELFRSLTSEVHFRLTAADPYQAKARKAAPRSFSKSSTLKLSLPETLSMARSQAERTSRL